MVYRRNENEVKEMKTRKARILLLIATVIIIMLLVWTSPGKTSQEWQVEDFYISKGDTLWKIAESYCPDDMDIRKWIYEVEKLNNRQTTDIYEGEVIKILISEK